MSEVEEEPEVAGSMVSLCAFIPTTDNIEEEPLERIYEEVMPQDPHDEETISLTYSDGELALHLVHVVSRGNKSVLFAAVVGSTPPSLAGEEWCRGTLAVQKIFIHHDTSSAAPSEGRSDDSAGEEEPPGRPFEVVEERRGGREDNAAPAAADRRRGMDMDGSGLSSSDKSTPPRSPAGRRVVTLCNLDAVGGLHYDRIRMYHRELRQIASVSTPGILPYYAFHRSDSAMYVVTDLCYGGTLPEAWDAVMGAKPMPEAILRVLLSPVMEGLATMHGKEIRHRNIRPAALFVDLDDNGRLRVRLGEFGDRFVGGGERSDSASVSSRATTPSVRRLGASANASRRHTPKRNATPVPSSHRSAKAWDWWRLACAVVEMLQHAALTEDHFRGIATPRIPPSASAELRTLLKWALGPAEQSEGIGEFVASCAWVQEGRSPSARTDANEAVGYDALLRYTRDRREAFRTVLRERQERPMPQPRLGSRGTRSSVFTSRSGSPFGESTVFPSMASSVRGLTSSSFTASEPRMRTERGMAAARRARQRRRDHFAKE